MALAAGYSNIPNVYGNYAINPLLMPQQQAQPQPQPVQDEMVWVSGINEANAYPVTPGTSKRLYDRDVNRFYIKTVDLSGMPMKLRIFTYKEITEPDKDDTDDSEYITKADLEAFKMEILNTIRYSKKNQNYNEKPQTTKEDK